MDYFEIEGGHSLKGNVEVSGAKNSALIIMMGSLISDKKITFHNVPNLQDTQTCIELLKTLNSQIQYDSSTKVFTAHATNPIPYAPYDLVRTMRASILCLGPLLGRLGNAKVSLPGGCAIGARPINLHLDVFKNMGAEIEIEQGYVLAKAKKLNPIHHHFPFISVGATENAILCAACIEGESRFDNCAREPEIDQVLEFVNLLGAKAHRDSNNPHTIFVQGTKSFKEVSLTIIPDRIECGTLLLAGLITNSEITIENTRPQDLSALLSTLDRCGVKIKISGNSMTALKHNFNFQGAEIETKEHPGFATDMQAQMASFLCFAKSQSVITENIFENRFMYVPELMRMGAKIDVHDKKITIHPSNIQGAIVMASDLRASAALVLAALQAKGTTKIRRIYHLDRGYENMEIKLSKIGAKILRQKE